MLAFKAGVGITVKLSNNLVRIKLNRRLRGSVKLKCQKRMLAGFTTSLEKTSLTGGVFRRRHRKPRLGQ